MKSGTTLLRNLALLGAMVVSAPLLTPRAATAQDGCLSQDFGDGSFCVGCRVGNCWAAACWEADGTEYRDGGCSPAPPPPIYA